MLQPFDSTLSLSLLYDRAIQLQQLLVLKLTLCQIMVTTTIHAWSNHIIVRQTCGFEFPPAEQMAEMIKFIDTRFSAP